MVVMGIVAAFLTPSTCFFQNVRDLESEQNVRDLESELP